MYIFKQIIDQLLKIISILINQLLKFTTLTLLTVMFLRGAPSYRVMWSLYCLPSMVTLRDIALGENTCLKIITHIVINSLMFDVIDDRPGGLA